MKIINTLTLSTFAILATVASADRGFRPPKPPVNDTNFKKQIKTAANFGNGGANGGAKIDICPTGDCDKGQLIRLAMARLEEVDADGTSVGNKAENFNKLDAEWTPMEEMVIDGVTTQSTSFASNVTVGPNGKSGTAEFNITANIYNNNGTTMNGNQSIHVPAGGLKFTVSIKNWPFKSSANHLHFGVTLKARGKDGRDGPKPERKPKKVNNGTDPKIDRCDMGEGMFMDAPAQAVLDDVQADINATIDATGPEVIYQWDFPYFNKTLYYDPVVGSEDEAAQPGYIPPPTTDGPVAPTPSPTKKNDGASWKVMSSVVAGVALIATAML